MKGFPVLLLAGLLATTYAAPRIVGGKDAPIEKYPYQAFLFDDLGFLCGASIIHKRYLLTAAHCVQGINAAQLNVSVGTNKQSGEGGQVYRAESFVIHENYQRPNGDHGVNDLALVRVRKDIEFNDVVQPIKLPNVDVEISDDANATFTGYGFRQYLGQFPENLQEIQLRVLNQTQCKAQWFFFKFILIEDTMLCTAGTRGEGVCNGDSGSPLTINGTLIGISSFGYPCALGIPDVFTRVSSYVDWINQFLS